MFQKIKRIVGIVLVAVFLFGVFYITYIRVADVPPGFFGYRLIRVSLLWRIITFLIRGRKAFCQL